MRIEARIAIMIPALALFACGINSNLGIPAGEAFRLGDNAHGAFRVAAENVGTVAVRVIAEEISGSRAQQTLLEPGAKIDATFPAGAIAVFVNEAAEDALVRVRIIGDTDLSMGYVETK